MADSTFGFLSLSPDTSQVQVGITTRTGGNGNHYFGNCGLNTGDIPDAVYVNRRTLANSLGLKPEHLIFCRQTHSSNIAIINSLPDFNMEPENTDGIITSLKNFGLAILTADCLPVAIYNSEGKAAGVVHAGWRGLANQIAPKAVRLIESEYNCPPSELNAIVGPGISSSVYETGKEVVSIFSDLGFASEKFIRCDSGKYFINLAAIAKQQLLNAGIDEKSIHVSPLCTYLNPDMFFSARRDSINTGRMATVVKISGK